QSRRAGRPRRRTGALYRAAPGLATGRRHRGRVAARHGLDLHRAPATPAVPRRRGRGGPATERRGGWVVDGGSWVLKDASRAEPSTTLHPRSTTHRRCSLPLRLAGSLSSPIRRRTKEGAMSDQPDLLARGREVTATLWGDL